MYRYNFDDLIKELGGLFDQAHFDKAYAHIKYSDKVLINETLFEHSYRSLYVTYYLIYNNSMLSNFFDIIKERFQKFDNFHNNDSDFILYVEKLFLKTFFFTSFFHDYGKLNFNFQLKKMGNISYQEIPEFQNKDFNGFKINDSTNHSMYHNVYDSLEEYIDEEVSFINDYLDLEEYYVLIEDLENLSSFIIEKHHGGLENLNKSLFNSTFIEIIFENDESFILELIHSIIINSDVLSTKYFSEFDISKFSLDSFLENIFDKNNSLLLNSFESVKEYNSNIYNNFNFRNIDFNTFSNNVNTCKNLNELKALNIKYIKDNLIFSDNISFYKGSTGIGKTNISFLLANEYLKHDINLKKFIYVAPQNNLVYQTFDSLLEHTTLDKDKISIINSIERRNNKKFKDSSNLSDSYYYENFYNDIVMTTSVNFFHKLIHKEKKDISNLVFLKDSFIIIDELQLLDDRFFNLIYSYLNYLSKFLNCKIVILSATVPVPKLSIELFNNKIPYIVDEKYMNLINDSILLKRYNYNLSFYENVNYHDSLNYLLNKKENNSILIVHNSISKLESYYNQIKDIIPNDYEVLFYNNNIIKPQLEYVIEKIRSGQKIIVLSTKKIETGIDVSFQQGIKFFDSFDNIEQFSGRINRYMTYNNSEVLILMDSVKYLKFAKQKRERISCNICSDLETIKKYIYDIHLYYEKIFNDDKDSYCSLLYNHNHIELNKLNLIEDYEKENFIVNIDIDSDIFSNLSKYLPPLLLEKILSDNKIKNIADLFNDSNKYKFIDYLDLFKIQCYVNKKTLFFRNEVLYLKHVNISLSDKYKDLYKILNIDNFYYDLNMGISFNKELEVDELIDLSNI